MSTSHIQALRTMLREVKGVILPGAPNALAARIIADLGFKAVYLTGAGLTNMHLGLPDLGFMDLSLVADHVMAVRSVIDLPLVVDGALATRSTSSIRFASWSKPAPARFKSRTSAGPSDADTLTARS